MYGYYDREGNPISLEQLIALRADKASRIVQRDELPGAITSYKVVSVFIGDDFEDELHGLKLPKPRIYGTGIFSTQGGLRDELFAEIRSVSEQETKERHNMLVEAIKAGTLDDAIKTMEQDRVN